MFSLRHNSYAARPTCPKGKARSNLRCNRLTIDGEAAGYSFRALSYAAAAARHTFAHSLKRQAAAEGSGPPSYFSRICLLHIKSRTFLRGDKHITHTLAHFLMRRLRPLRQRPSQLFIPHNKEFIPLYSILTNYPLLFTHCSRPNHCSLLIAHCSLLIAHC